MRPTVSVAIQAHPERAEMAEGLLECIGGAAEIVYDPDPYGTYRSPWRTYREALERTPPGATHRLIVQDDVLVCDYFLEGVAAAVRARPERVLCFFVAGHPPPYRRDVLAACERDESWAELDLATNSWIPVVATCWPVELIGRLLRWFDARFDAGTFPPGFTADDEIVGRFLRGADLRPLASVPSLVEHPDTVRSLTNPHRRSGDGTDPRRRAACWIGDCGFCDARLIDWTTGPG